MCRECGARRPATAKLDYIMHTSTNISNLVQTQGQNCDWLAPADRAASRPAGSRRRGRKLMRFRANRSRQFGSARLFQLCCCHGGSSRPRPANLISGKTCPPSAPRSQLQARSLASCRLIFIPSRLILFARIWPLRVSISLRATQTRLLGPIVALFASSLHLCARRRLKLAPRVETECRAEKTAQLPEQNSTWPAQTEEFELNAWVNNHPS